MKKDQKYNHPSIQRPSAAPMKQYKTPQASFHQNMCKNMSQSVSAIIGKSNCLQPNTGQRDSSFIQKPNNLIGASLRTKNLHEKKHSVIVNPASVNNSFVSKRLSQQPVKSHQGAAILDQSFNHTIDDEFYYSGEGCKNHPASLLTLPIVISKSMGGPKKHDKSPQHLSSASHSNSQFTGNSGSASFALLNQKRNSMNSQIGSNNGGVDSSTFSSAFKQINNFMIDPAQNIVLNPSSSKYKNSSVRSSSKHTKNGSIISNKAYISQPLTMDKRQQGKNQVNQQHYENLMLQQLMKQQKQSEKQQNLQQNLSLLSLDTAKPTSGQPTPHMMLNISYNMNNNINHNMGDANASFVFQQEPGQIKTLIGLLDETEKAKRAKEEVYKTQDAGAKYHISYDNPVLQPVKVADPVQREQSFDMVVNKKKKRKTKFHSNARSGKVSKSRSNSSKTRGTQQKGTKNDDSSRGVIISGGMQQSSGSSSNPKRKWVNSKGYAEKENTTANEQTHPCVEDRHLFAKLDQALTNDLQDKSSSQRVSICSKVLSEIIRRQDPLMSSLLTKIKLSYEQHIKSQKQTLSEQQRQLTFEQQLKEEKQERKMAEGRLESLSKDMKVQKQNLECQEKVIQEMRQQISQYRKEIIELSTSKKVHARAKKNSGGVDRNGMVPKLDLTKVKQDGEESGSSDDDLHDPKVGENHVTYQQYMRFLEQESRFEDMGEESQESLIRQEELKERKNKIIQLLNGEISDEEDGDEHVNQSSDDEELRRNSNSEEADVDIITASDQGSAKKKIANSKQKQKSKSHLARSFDQ